jgi:hypothetical protein
VRVFGLVRYRLRPDGTWIRSLTSERRQPEDGFTVAAYEYETDLEALCLAYEIADEEGRAMIRLVSELSVNTVNQA